MLATFLTPALLLYSRFRRLPAVLGAAVQPVRLGGHRPPRLRRAQNFVDLFTTFPLDEQLVSAFGHNVVFFLGTMLIQNTLGLTFAVLLYRRRITKRLFQTLYTLPYLVSPLVVGYLWVLMLRPQFGALNALLRRHRAAVDVPAMARPARHRAAGR